MFGWLRKSSKEPSNNQSSKRKSNARVKPHYVLAVDDRVRPKSLDQDFENIDDPKDRPHSVTAARPFFQATKHLDQQQAKQEVQTNYLSDDNDTDNKKNDENSTKKNDELEHVATPPPQNKSAIQHTDDNVLNLTINNNKNSNIINNNNYNNAPSQPLPKKNIIAAPISEPIPKVNIIETVTKNITHTTNMDQVHMHKNEIAIEELSHSMDSNTSKQSADNIPAQYTQPTIPKTVPIETEKTNRNTKINQNQPSIADSKSVPVYVPKTNTTGNNIPNHPNITPNRKILPSNAKTRGFTKRESTTFNKAKRESNASNKAKRDSHTKRDSNTFNKAKRESNASNKVKLKLQRRRSSGKKTRSFSPETMQLQNMQIQMQSKTLPPKISETVPQKAILTIATPPAETEKTKRKKKSSTKTPITQPNIPAISEPATFDNTLTFTYELTLRIETWLKKNNLYFPTNNKGHQLLTALLDSGIENPVPDLSLLSAYPDLHEIAAMAHLNILERRKFINAAHLNITAFHNNTATATEPTPNTNKKVVVMSTEEQQALARMDCIIEQLKNTRNLIKHRISHMNDGGVAYEKIIRREFEILRHLLCQREQQLIDEMKSKINAKISMLNDLDHDLLMTLEACQQSKINAQKLMKTNEQPRVSRQKWRVLQGRKKKVINIIEDCVSQNVMQHANKSVASLIISSMSMQDIMPTLPQPLIAQYQPSKHRIYSYPHHHKRHYDSLNNYLLNIFTKNMEQIHMELSVPGFAFNYTQRSKMHKLLTQYGVICDVEQQLTAQLVTLFPAQFGQMHNDEIMNAVKGSKNKHQYTKSINLNLATKANKKKVREKEKEKEVKEGAEVENILPLSSGVLSHDILSADFKLINPEDWEQQIMDKKKRKSRKGVDWKPYASLTVNVLLKEKEINEWQLIEQKLKEFAESEERKMKKLNRFNEDRFNELDDFDAKESFKLDKFFANIVANERKDVVRTQRVKEIELQIGMKRKSKMDSNEDICMNMAWISLGWIDVQSVAVKDEEKESEIEKLKEEKEQIPEQYKKELFEDEQKVENEENKNAKLLSIPFALKRHFQELMTQTFLASLELEMMTDIDEKISKQEMEKLVIQQLANDELFEFNSRNVNEFEKKFIICVRTRCRDRINIKMTNMNLPTKPPDIVNKNKDILLPLKAKQNESKTDEISDEMNINEGNGLRECNLIVFQSTFSDFHLVSFSLLRAVIVVLKERKNKLDSKFVNGFVSIVGNESLQFIDPISGSKAILSQSLPPDSESCGLIIDFIRFKHPTNDNNGMHNSNDDINAINNMNNDELLTHKLRNVNKKLSIIRIAGRTNENILCGRLDIYNLFSNSWVMIGELLPYRENMSCTMFYGRVCVTGGNIKNNNFEPTNICQEFSFSERKWKPLKSMNKARFGHCMCTFDTKPTKLFVYGGEVVNGDWTNSVEMYNPQKREWKQSGGSKYNRYGAACCIWKGFGVIVVGGQCEGDQSSKHNELYNISTSTWSHIQIKDLNYEHGLFPAVWCDSDDNCIYVASQFVVDNKNKENTQIQYRVEMLDHPNNKWRIIKLSEGNNQFMAHNPFKLVKSSAVWNANVVRKSIGASIKIS